MTRPRLLDAYCKAGGAAMGWHRAGFDVVGVDIEPQPNYPFEFVQGDAIEYAKEHGHEYAILTGGPPCQKWTAYRRRGGGVGDGYPDLIGKTREVFVASGRPYVIENIEPARAELVDPIRLCGSSFRLDVRRHRLFESSLPLTAPLCDHSWQTPRFPPASNRANLRSTVEIGVYRIPLDTQRRAMGVDWMTLTELSNAIPPAYTEHLGRQILAQLERINP